MVLSRKVNYRNRNEVNEGNFYNAIESAVALGISLVINIAVISTFAVYVIKHPSQKDLSLEEASHALHDTIGPAAKYIWAIGLLASGQASTMTGTYAGQFVMEGFLNFKLPVYQRVLLTRSIAVVPAMSISFMGPKKLTELDTFLNILQSVLLPFSLVPLVKLVADKNVMREFAISRCQLWFASVVGVILFIFNFVTVFGNGVLEWYVYLIVGIGAMIYFCLIGMVIMEKTTPIKLLTEKQLEANEVEYG